jgi:LysM repeat protein
MRSPFFCICFLGLTATLSSLSAQTPVDNDADLKRQIAALREAVIQQTRQIDSLTAEIERLGVSLGQRRPAKTEPTTSQPPTVNTTATASPSTTPPPPVPTATPDPNIIQHSVVRGDNLTNIAKKYGTTVEAIQKLNKITDARKMQVGQVISIPSPAPTTAATPTPAPSATTPTAAPANQ